MDIILSNRSKEPIYLQIKEQVKKAILDHQLKPGDPLPSIRKLAKELEVSVITTKRAYEELEKDGFIESTVGRGSFVAGQADEWIREQQLKRIEFHLAEAAKEGKAIGMSDEELKDLLDLLCKEDQ